MRTHSSLREVSWITCALVVLQLGVLQISAATITWTNTLGGAWNTAANWTPNAVPGASDTANITTAGTYTVDVNVNATVAALNLGGASGKQTLTLTANTLSAIAAVVGGNGIFSMSSGGLTGKVTVQSGGVLNFLTSANKNIYSLIIDNQGTVNHVAGSLIGGSTPATIITNSGLWDIQGDLTLSDYFGGPGSEFHNLGTLRKSAGTGVAYVDGFDLFNTGAGIIQANTGTLRLPSGYINTGGILRLAGGKIDGTSLGFAGGVLDGTGTFGGNTFVGGTISPGVSGPGQITFVSGLNLGTAVTVALDALNTTPVSGYDQLSVLGPISITNAVLQFTANSSIPIGSKLLVITNDSTDAITGNFSGKPQDSLFSAGQQLYRVRYNDGSGNDMAIVRDDGGVRLTGIKINLDGHFEFSGLGTNGVTYTIYAAPLVPTNKWDLIGTTTADVAGHFSFIDTNAWKYPMRYYQSLDNP